MVSGWEFTGSVQTRILDSVLPAVSALTAHIAASQFPPCSSDSTALCSAAAELSGSLSPGNPRAAQQALGEGFWAFHSPSCEGQSAERTGKCLPLHFQQHLPCPTVSLLVDGHRPISTHSPEKETSQQLNL